MDNSPEDNLFPLENHEPTRSLKKIGKSGKKARDDLLVSVNRLDTLPRRGFQPNSCRGWCHAD